jgi:AcrR family transcriptional regulator
MVPLVNDLIKEQGRMTVVRTPATDPGGAGGDEGPVRRPLRSDAQRNHERILEAADEMFAIHGVDASMDEIATRAGVGVGTLYRNFPTKEALLQALFVARMQPLINAAREAVEADDPGEAFVGFMRRLGEEFVNFKALAEVMASAGVDPSAKAKAADELMQAGDALLQRAQKAGDVRPDVSIADVAALMSSLGYADSSVTPTQRSRCVALACDALLVRARSLLPRRTTDKAPTRRRGS